MNSFNLFQSKPTAILYLRRQDAVLVMKSTSVKLEISTDFVRNLEVIAADKLSELIAGFLDSHGCRGQQVLLVLDGSIVFQKEAGVGDQAADFESKVPFDPENRQLLTVSQENQQIFFGANKALYSVVAQGIQKNNKLKAVVPAVVYGVHESEKIDKHVLKAFFNDSIPQHQANFLIKS
jgi:hypothetical protein